MLIGLCGLAGSGKTSVARMLVDHHNFARKPFAYRLKLMLGALGFSNDVLDGPSAGKEIALEMFAGKTLRHALQSLGTEWGRDHFGQDFWVNIWKRSGLPPGINIVAEDVRFENEADAIVELGGYVVWVQREGAGSKVGPGHRSEAMDGFGHDFIIENTGTMAELEQTVAGLVKLISREEAHGAEKIAGQIPQAVAQIEAQPASC